VHGAAQAYLLIGGGLLILGVTFFIFIVRYRRGELTAHRSAVAPPALTCPTCRRGFPPGMRFCPLDATRLTPPAEGATGQRAHGGKCPRCRRAFEAGVRYCPMDAEELLPLGQAQSEPGAPPEHTFADHLLAGDGKICPVCASKYDLEAGYCGRDASELVTVN
jgi:predicted amidophosphoribosyltransferase